LVGGWEDKMRSATAWAVVNTTSPNVGVGTVAMHEEEEDVEGRRDGGEEGVGSKNVG